MLDTEDCILEHETRAFWRAAKRIRLIERQDTPEDLGEEFDDLLTIYAHTDSELLTLRCCEILNKELGICGFSA